MFTRPLPVAAENTLKTRSQAPGPWVFAILVVPLVLFLAALGCQGSTAAAQQLMSEDSASPSSLPSPLSGPGDQGVTLVPPSVPGSVGAPPSGPTQSTSVENPVQAEPGYQASPIAAAVTTSDGPVVLSSATLASDQSTYLLFNQKWLEGQFQSSLEGIPYES